MDTWYTPETDDNYRAMLAYDLDLTQRAGWVKWLGRHRFLGLWTRQDVHRQAERWRNGYVDGVAASLGYTSMTTWYGTFGDSGLITEAVLLGSVASALYDFYDAPRAAGRANARNAAANVALVPMVDAHGPTVSRGAALVGRF